MIPSFGGSSADAVWQMLVQEFRQSHGIRNQSGRGGPTKELLHVAISITDPRQRWIVSREPPLNLAFALAEVVWIIRGRRDLAFLDYWNSKYREFVGPGPDLHGAYGYRLRGHLGFDQLKRAYQVLKHNHDTRQVVLQIWDSKVDLPRSSGSPVDPDVPCNLMAMPKLRNEKLEWLQIIRSNDLFLGIPHNLVQFTCMQEVLAGWLGVECGTYNQVSDSLHVYDRDWQYVMNSNPTAGTHRNVDSLVLSWEQSEWVFKELESRIELMIDPETNTGNLVDLSDWDAAPQAYRNIVTVLVAEALRRRNESDIADQVMASCSNPMYLELWKRWRIRWQKAGST